MMYFGCKFLVLNIKLYRIQIQRSKKIFLQFFQLCKGENIFFSNFNYKFLFFSLALKYNHPVGQKSIRAITTIPVLI